MQHNNTNYDAIIVGGGHNGLVAASYLAKAGKSVLLLEAKDELGGATTSVKPFPDYDARLSRYSYLVSLLPDQIVADLGIQFKTLERSVSSYTPYHREGRDDGLLVSMDWDESTASGFRRLTGSDREGAVWREFYGEIAQLARRFAPSMLKPLKSAAELKAEIGLPGVWRNLMEVPIGGVIRGVPAGLGDPTTTDDYRLCVFADDGVSPRVVLSAAAAVDKAAAVVAQRSIKTPSAPGYTPGAGAPRGGPSSLDWTFFFMAIHCESALRSRLRAAISERWVVVVFLRAAMSSLSSLRATRTPIAGSSCF